MLSWIDKVQAGKRRFLRSNRGAIAPMFALMIVPITLSVGVAVDMGRAITARNNLQDALDATGLAISHMGYTSSTPTATVQASANQWIRANVHDQSICGTVNASGACNNISVSVTPSTQNVVLTANATVATMLGGLAGISQVPISASTTVQWGLSHIELALVLDNTGSMADDNKIQTLISSANALVNTVSASASASNDPNALKISVVPFSDTVNIGTSYYNSVTKTPATWLTGSLPSAYGADIFTTAGTNRFPLFTTMGTSWGGCVEARMAPYDVQDTGPNPTVPGSMFVAFFSPDEPGTGNSNSYPNDYLPDGLTSSRSVTYTWQQLQGNPLKYVGTPRSGTSSSGYSFGPNAGCSGLQSLLRLTTDTSAVHTKINAMNAIGDTNIVQGLMWGWHTLSPNTPFADGVAYGTPNTTKIVVLLTDGMNTETDDGTNDGSFYSGLGFIWQGRLGLSTNASANQRQAAMDARQTLLCNNMKAQNIVIYTVQIDTPGTAPAALSGCASDASKFYDVQDVSNLNTAFQAIAGSIGHLRISQ